MTKLSLPPLLILENPGHAMNLTVHSSFEHPVVGFMKNTEEGAGAIHADIGPLCQGGIFLLPFSCHQDHKHTDGLVQSQGSGCPPSHSLVTY